MPHPRSDIANFVPAAGATGLHLRAHDWARTPLGPPSLWPVGLRNAACLLSVLEQPALVVWGAAQTCLCNDAARRALDDIAWDGVLGQPASAVFALAWPALEASFSDAIAGRRPAAQVSHAVSLPGGGPHPVRWVCSLNPVEDERTPAGIGGAIVLLSPDAAPDERRDASAARWRPLFEQSPGFTCMLSGPQHVYVYCNPAYRKLIGHDDALGRRVADVLPWAVEQGYIALLDRVYQTGEPYVARGAALTMAQRSTEPQRYLDYVYQPVRSEAGTVTGILVLGSDVTEQHHAEVALHTSEQRLRIASEAAALGIYDLDLQTQTLHWDTRMQALWGSEQVGSVPHPQMIESVHPDDRQAKRAAFERAAAPGSDGHFQCEYRVIDAAAGVTRWIHANGQVLFEGGQPQRVIGAVQDISERKRADARRDEFLATLGHELRNPLAPIGNALKVLQRVVEPTGSAGPALAVVDRQFHHVVRLLDDLLDAVRLQHGRFALRKARVSLADVLEQAHETASAQLEARGNRLDQRLPRTPVWLDADALRLAQVVSNLLINASKYSEAGSVIELAAERRDDDTVSVSVSDHGIGIEPAFLERVFETFSQTQLALERTQGGLGIGLALARGIVGLHGGRITAHSAGRGHGSRFVLDLPLAPQRIEGQRREEPRIEPPMRAVAETAGDAGADLRLAGRRILLVEDNHDHAETLSVLLGLYGARVRWVPDGLSALEAAREHQPDTILLDLGLPGLNGYEVCRQLREQPWAKSICILALTGWGQPADRQRTTEAGFDQHLLKPVDFDALLTLLTR